MNKLDATYNECSLRDLKWALLAQKGKEGQQLPPALGTLIPNVHRDFYMTPIWKLSQKPCPQFPITYPLLLRIIRWQTYTSVLSQPSSS